jgi:hypothetical protein
LYNRAKDKIEAEIGSGHNIDTADNNLSKPGSVQKRGLNLKNRLS